MSTTKIRNILILHKYAYIIHISEKYHTWKKYYKNVGNDLSVNHKTNVVI